MTDSIEPAWATNCERWRGRVLTGEHGHWCEAWDGLPIDETCEEWPCACDVGQAFRKSPTFLQRAAAMLHIESVYWRGDNGEPMYACPKSPGRCKSCFAVATNYQRLSAERYADARAAAGACE